MNDNKKKIIIVSAVALVLLLIIGGTFAYFMAQGNGSASKNVNVTTHTTDSLVFNIDKEIVIDADQDNFASGKGNQDDTAIATATLKANSATNTATVTYNVFFLIDDNDYEYTTTAKTAELILSVKKNGTPVTSIEGLTPVTVNGVSGFDITERKDNIEIAKDEAITVPADDVDHTIEDIWEVTVTLVNLDSDQNNNTGKTLNGRVYLSKNSSFLQVKNAIASKTEDSITVTLNMTENDIEIDKYYFAIEEKSNAVALANTKPKVVRLSNTNLTYQKSDEPSYTFTGLTEGKIYNVYAYAQDTNGNKSNEYQKEIKLVNITLANYIKDLYTAQGENNLYHHDGTIMATEANSDSGVKVEDVLDANDGSYRYSGAYESVNNWVCFGSSASKCPENNLYRIIGVFNEKVLNENGTEIGTTEDRVKLIMNNYAGESVLGKAQDGATAPYSYFTGPSKPSEKQPAYAWSGSTSTSASTSNWIISTLNTDTLNGTYLTKLGDTWSSKMALTKWQVGGNTDVYKAKAATTYKKEIVSPAKSTIEKKKVGLMYASDYGFSASPDNWNKILNSYGNDTTKNNNWLYRGVNEWTITISLTSRSDMSFAFNVNDNGALNDAISIVRYAKGARPAFYLNSSVLYEDGDGTQSNPFRIN